MAEIIVETRKTYKFLSKSLDTWQDKHGNYLTDPKAIVEDIRELFEEGEDLSDFCDIDDEPEIVNVVIRTEV